MENKFFKIKDFRFKLEDVIAYMAGNFLASENPDHIFYIAIYFRNGNQKELYFGVDGEEFRDKALLSLDKVFGIE